MTQTKVAVRTLLETIRENPILECGRFRVHRLQNGIAGRAGRLSPRIAAGEAAHNNRPKKPGPKIRPLYSGNPAKNSSDKIEYLRFISKNKTAPRVCHRPARVSNDSIPVVQSRNTITS